jgi:two-component system LytT family response regulator
MVNISKKNLFQVSGTICLYYYCCSMTQPLHILLVDDERLSRLYLHDLIREVEPHAAIFEAKSVAEAMIQFDQQPIDILFTDIRMPQQDGFDLLNSIARKNFELVFVTAYAQYAMQAIKQGAVDYLLKPIQKEEFRETFQKVSRRVYEKKQQQINANTVLSDRLALSHSKGIKFMTLKDIVYFEGANTYTTIILANGERVVSSKPISRFEQTLHPDWFFRIHKSYLINIFHFEEYISRDGDLALMSNKDKLTISRYRLSEFLKRVQDLSGRLKI